jgi:hypothetical protein
MKLNVTFVGGYACVFNRRYALITATVGGLNTTPEDAELGYRKHCMHARRGLTGQTFADLTGRVVSFKPEGRAPAGGLTLGSGWQYVPSIQHMNVGTSTRVHHSPEKRLHTQIYLEEGTLTPAGDPRWRFDGEFILVNTMAVTGPAEVIVAITYELEAPSYVEMHAGNNVFTFGNPGQDNDSVHEITVLDSHDYPIAWAEPGQRTEHISKDFVAFYQLLSFMPKARWVVPRLWLGAEPQIRVPGDSCVPAQFDAP